jgi:hypothetical protein
MVFRQTLKAAPDLEHGGEHGARAPGLKRARVRGAAPLRALEPRRRLRALLRPPGAAGGNAGQRSPRQALQRGDRAAAAAAARGLVQPAPRQVRREAALDAARRGSEPSRRRLPGGGSAALGSPRHHSLQVARRRGPAGAAQAAADQKAAAQRLGAARGGGVGLRERRALGRAAPAAKARLEVAAQQLQQELAARARAAAGAKRAHGSAGGVPGGGDSERAERLRFFAASHLGGKGTREAREECQAAPQAREQRIYQRNTPVSVNAQAQER